MAQAVRFLFEVFQLNDDGTKTLMHEGITEATTFSVSGLSTGWYVAHVTSVSPSGARSEPTRLPFFVQQDGGSMFVSRERGVRSGAASHVQ